MRSWQFGLTICTVKWNGTYKGKADKAEKYPFEGMFTRSTNLLKELYLSSENIKVWLLTNPHSASSNARNGLGSGYGLEVQPKTRTLVAINIEASLRPKDATRSAVSIVGVEAPRLDIKCSLVFRATISNTTLIRKHQKNSAYTTKCKSIY